MKKCLVVMLLLACSTQLFAEDIDLYINNTSSNIERPSVIIILDNSGSMLWDINDNELGDGTTVNNTNTKAYLAREIIVDLINDNPDVDFALQLFNPNEEAVAAAPGYWTYWNNNWYWVNVPVPARPAIHGGRIVYGLNDLSVTQNKDDLMAILYSNQATGTFRPFEGGATPLCETLYETYQYLSGGEVYYGNDSPTTTPESILTAGSYVSPFNNIVCDKQITIIYITDGAATRDDDAANVVEDITGDSSTFNGNYLGNLGSWMGETNFASVPTKPISQTTASEVLGSVKLHTVGFGAVSADNDAVDLLKLASRHGINSQENTGFRDTPAGGRYHQASTAEALKESLDTVIKEVKGSSSLTSASVSANSFDRTQTLDSVYYGMFEPTSAARWQGNIKKYKIVNGIQKGANGVNAVDSNGQFSQTTKSFWSTDVDGNEVAQGGVAEMLRDMSTVNRTLLTDINGNGSLTTFSQTEIESTYTTDAQLAAKFAINVADIGDVTDHINWAKGIDVDNEDINSNIRPDIFGDPLHSKPVVINYGKDTNGNTINPRIVVGTNSGVLHMFEDVLPTDSNPSNTVKESWAYFPNEFFKNIKPLRDNVIAADNKIYGLDGEITLHINDVLKDGTIDPATDTVWLFFGLRRGGTSYYALDITVPDAPKLMWHKTKTGNFSNLGLTFSKPKVIKSAYNTTDSDKLVVIFGGGYDSKKDNPGVNSNDDDDGSAIYMVNARTGNKIFKQSTGSDNGVASSIASLDSDSDGLVDRLYTGDTGGNVFRLDMPDNSKTNRSIFKLAELGSNTDLEDRRFFNEPLIVRTYLLESTNTGTDFEPNIVKKEVPYDAILLGSGDRATPTDIDTDDMFFMIKDKYIKTQKFGSTPATSVPSAITLDMLYNYTNDPFSSYPNLTTLQEQKLITASQKSGWYYELEDDGEKNSAKATVIDNTVYFTSYSPTVDSTCTVVPGESWLYAVNLALGIKKYNWSADSENRGDKIKKIDNQFVGEATIVRTPVTDPISNETTMQGNIIVSKELIEVGFQLRTMRSSLTIPETQ